MKLGAGVGMVQAVGSNEKRKVQGDGSAARSWARGDISTSH